MASGHQSFTGNACHLCPLLWNDSPRPIVLVWGRLSASVAGPDLEAGGRREVGQATGRTMVENG